MTTASTDVERTTKRQASGPCTGCSDQALRWLSLAGLAGPLLFTLAWVAGDLLRASYNWITDPISLLAAVDARYAWIMSAGFIVGGLLTLPMAVGLHCGIEDEGRASPLGPLLVAVAGIAAIVAGVFRPNYPDVLPGRYGWFLVNPVHQAAAFVVFVALVTAPLLIVPRLHADPRWRGLTRYSLLTSSATFVLFLAYLAPMPGLIGLLERLLVSVPLLWLEVMAIRLHRQATARQRSPGAGDDADLAAR